MAMRKIPFVNNEYYHIFNRGVDKRQIFCEYDDIDRFLQSINEFNVINPIGSLFENSFRKKESLGSSTSKLVNIVCYCLNPNHYHLILEQIYERGIEKFMQRLGTGFTNYFNKKYGRNGALFQGRFKSIHISSNEYLLHLSSYVNLNNKVHRLGSSTSKLLKRSSWDEYTNNIYNGFCKKDIVLGQFKNKKEYKKFAEEALEGILERRKEMEEFLLE